MDDVRTRESTPDGEPVLGLKLVDILHKRLDDPDLIARPVMP